MVIIYLATFSLIFVFFKGDFPFVERLRCKDVKVQLRMNRTWKHRDLCYNEINEEMARQSKVAGYNNLGNDVQVINDLDEEDSSMDDDDYDNNATPNRTPVKTMRSGSMHVTSIKSEVG